LQAAKVQCCPGCGRLFDPLQGKYAPDGSIVCVPCGEQLAAAHVTPQQKSAGSAFVGAAGAVVMALLSFALQLRISFLAIPLVAAFFGGGTAYVALRHPDAERMLGWKRLPTVTLGGVAIVLAIVSVIVNA
jgi:hypothetical protein